MPRHRGALEERLRAAVKVRVQERGDPALLAKKIKKSQSFVKGYLEGTSHANLDTTVAIARFYGFSLRMLTGLDLYPAFDEEIQALADAYHNALSDDLRDAAFAVLGAPGIAQELRARRSPLRRVPTSRGKAKKGY